MSMLMSDDAVRTGGSAAATLRVGWLRSLPVLPPAAAERAAATTSPPAP